jgi:hypothetical protein
VTDHTASLKPPDGALPPTAGSQASLGSREGEQLPEGEAADDWEEAAEEAESGSGGDEEEEEEQAQAAAPTSSASMALMDEVPEYSADVVRSIQVVDQLLLNNDMIESLVVHIVTQEKRHGPGALLRVGDVRAH